jgi:hypothetical protein
MRCLFCLCSKKSFVSAQRKAECCIKTQAIITKLLDACKYAVTALGHQDVGILNSLIIERLRAVIAEAESEVEE